ncbi:MAG: 2,3-bisphosphoglycerate-independent phosphoglycerate mutase [Candidatus Eremiobacteraeota bacterium]|nr:2,3-bisphosphoglycerate-independent phosphoglycerate mutase [Candidatus Eremiobacteraeota bacterium]
MRFRPVVICVLDGWGCSEAIHGNAVAAARLPNWHGFFRRFPWTTLAASGEAVGLPKGIMGNSEVGHTNLGSGRVVAQGQVFIDESIADGTFARNPVLTAAIDHVKGTGGTLHLMGLVSAGRVHSSLEHLFALIDAAVGADVPLAVHAFLDGRDTPPRSAETYLTQLERKLEGAGRTGAIGSICGRYYAMDRDGRWERTRRAYSALVTGKADYAAAGALRALHDAYRRGEDDEFVLPAIVGVPRPVRDGDSVVFFNFRPDRARQLTRAFDAGSAAYRRDGFDAFAPQTYRDLVFATMTKYDESYLNPVLFGPRPQHDTFGEVVARAGMRQLRLAETEKYAHVTYFFNGGREEKFPGEDRLLIPSDRSVPTYDLKPAMRAAEITDAAASAIAERTYDVIVMNYANADMVGHTGKWQPTIDALEVLDGCMERLANATRQAGGLLVITADHGNAEEKLDCRDNPLTAHTTNPVPLLFVADSLEGTLAAGGKLGDVAPTLLRLMDLPVPAQMRGNDLFTNFPAIDSSRPLSG